MSDIDELNLKKDNIEADLKLVRRQIYQAKKDAYKHPNLNLQEKTKNNNMKLLAENRRLRHLVLCIEWDDSSTYKKLAGELLVSPVRASQILKQALRTAKSDIMMNRICLDVFKTNLGYLTPCDELEQPTHGHHVEP
jgi:hypothetical protein